MLPLQLGGQVSRDRNRDRTHTHTHAQRERYRDSESERERETHREGDSERHRQGVRQRRGTRRRDRARESAYPRSQHGHNMLPLQLGGQVLKPLKPRPGAETDRQGVRQRQTDRE
jgi:hypothetical protein